MNARTVIRFRLRWSITWSFLNRSVLVLSPRAPLPLCSRLSAETCEWASPEAIRSSVASIAAIASRSFALRDLPCLDSTMPVGKCLSLHEFGCLLRCCPPHPDPLNHSTSKSSAARRAYSGLASPPDVQATVTVLVWTLPPRSVFGMRWILNPPDSASIRLSASTANTVSLLPPLREHFQPSLANIRT